MARGVNIVAAPPDSGAVVAPFQDTRTTQQSPFSLTPTTRRINAFPVAPPPNVFGGTSSPSSTEINYGFGNDQFLTDKQQQISDSVQHAFAQSLAQRDREMQRYQMPQLSSFHEDEALARAIATANLANRPPDP